jgi:hypothetical protein
MQKCVLTVCRSAPPPAYLLCESYREGKKVRKRTLADLSAPSDEQTDATRAVLSGQSERVIFNRLWRSTHNRRNPSLNSGCIITRAATGAAFTITQVCASPPTAF